MEKIRNDKFGEEYVEVHCLSGIMWGNSRTLLAFSIWDGQIP